MIISIYAIGKTKKDFCNIGIQEYEKRLKKYQIKIKWIFLEPTRAATVNQQKYQDTINIIKRLDPVAPVVVLDRQGKPYSSQSFSEFLNSFQATGSIQCIIGGSHGLDSSLFPASFSLVSFSEMTFEHDVIRVMLLEQLYRAFDIQHGGSYHK